MNEEETKKEEIIKGDESTLGKTPVASVTGPAPELLRDFFFPQFGKVVKAATREEAEKIISVQSKK